VNILFLTANTTDNKLKMTAMISISIRIYN
jgi:hypothetical protein